MLTDALKRELLRIARSSITAAIQDELVPAVGRAAQPAELLRPGRAFVTLRIEHELRGCIGYMDSSLSLAQVVAEVAAKAAVDDPRFPPLTPAELDRATVEISILSPAHRIYSKNDIRIGEHGLILEVGLSKGVLLPQVAVEYGWNAEQFLEGVCRKSGLPETAWQDPEASFSVFTAEVINEEEILRVHSS